MYGAMGMDVWGDWHGCMGRLAWMYGEIGMDVCRMIWPKYNATYNRRISSIYTPQRGGVLSV